MITRNTLGLGCGLLALALAGCATKTHVTPPTRSVTEQLLLDQTLEQTLNNASLPMRPGRSVAVEVAGLTGDADFVKAAVTRWLARKGFRVPEDKAEDYVLKVMVHAFGTNVSDRFVGIPPISAWLFPLALPELALYKHDDQAAVANFSMDLYERANGKLALSTPTYEGYAYLRDATMLFGIKQNSTNLESSVP